MLCLISLLFYSKIKGASGKILNFEHIRGASFLNGLQGKVNNLNKICYYV